MLDNTWTNFFTSSTTAPLNSGLGATSTALAQTIASTLFTAFLNLFNQILPWAIGVLIFFIGYRFARRILAGY